MSLTYDVATLTTWRLIKGMPQPDDRTFHEVFGYDCLDWMTPGAIWKNAHGGNQNCFYLCHPRYITKGMMAQLTQWCENHFLWYMVEGLSIYQPGKRLALFVVKWEHEFEYA